MLNPDLITTKDIAKLAEVTYQTVLNYIADGKVSPPMNRAGLRAFYHISEIKKIRDEIKIASADTLSERKVKMSQKRQEYLKKLSN